MRKDLKKRLELKPYQRAYTTLIQFVVENGFADLWEVRLDGKCLDSLCTLRQAHEIRKAHPGSLLEIRIAERDGSVLPKSPWFEPYDDTTLRQKLAAVVPWPFKQRRQRGDS